MAGLRLATFLRLYSSDKVELGVHLARLPASPLLTELVSNWLLGEVPCIIVPATAPAPCRTRRPARLPPPCRSPPASCS